MPTSIRPIKAQVDVAGVWARLEIVEFHEHPTLQVGCEVRLQIQIDLVIGPGEFVTIADGILAAGDNNPMDALKNAMIIGALPFTIVMLLMCIALGKALYRDGLREKGGIVEQPAE